MKNLAYLRLFGHKLSCIWSQGSKSS